MGKISRIGVLTGGGDAPGLNAVIRAVVKTATLRYGWSVTGIEDGFEGLLGVPKTCPLGPAEVRGLLPRGGTILGTVNRGNFLVIAGGNKVARNEAAYREAADNIARMKLDALIVIGGEGTQRTAYDFALMGIPVVGVPKTIDNDLAGTDLTFGFDTAVSIATEALDRLHTTAESHDRVLILEVMGRHAGWIALHAGLGGGADVILLPEIPFYIEKVAGKVLEREREGHKFSIIVVSEGALPAGGEAVYLYAGAPDGAPRLGGIGHAVAAEVSRLTEKEARVVVLGHLQRGGTPTAFDRVLASEYGSAAVHALAEGRSNHLVSRQNNVLTTVPLDVCVKAVKVVPVDHQLLVVARDLGISFAGEMDC
jgi:6-phosphofructokinase 1